jgi:hypothetical protein
VEQDPSKRGPAGALVLRKLKRESHPLVGSFWELCHCVMQHAVSKDCDDVFTELHGVVKDPKKAASIGWNPIIILDTQSHRDQDDA